MIKSWLVTTMAPFYGTEQYYTVFSEKDPLEIDEVQNWFWNEETENLWDAYSYLSDSDFDTESEEWEGNEDEFWEQKLQEWKEGCNINAEEMSLEDLQAYISGGPKSETDLPEIIYDEREK
jgi:hypothetical protein